MRQEPFEIISSRDPEHAFFEAGRRVAGVFVGTCAALALLGSASTGRSQTFIRVPAPSVQQQDQSTVNAMPNPNGATEGGSAPQAAVLSDTGGVVKMVDQNGNEIGNHGWSFFHGWRPTFYLNIGVAYDDNIYFLSHKTDDLITRLQPGVVFGWGDYREQLPRLGAFAHEYEVPNDALLATKFFYVDYHPTIQIFAQNTQQDVVNESVLASGSYQFSKLIVQGQLQYQTLSDVNVDVGGRLNSTLYSGVVTGIYQVDDKTAIESTASSYSVQYDGEYQSSVDSKLTTYLNYQLFPKLNVSGGLVVGYLAPQETAAETYQQVGGRIRWLSSDKLYLYATGGLEVRESTDGTNTVDGVFDAELNYAPFDGTRFLLSASRGTASTADNFFEDTIVTQVQVGVQQRLFGRVYANGRVSYQNNDYEYESRSYRTDNTVDFHVSLAMDITAYAGIQLAYQFLNNDSTAADRVFNVNVFGLQLDLTY